MSTNPAESHPSSVVSDSYEIQSLATAPSSATIVPIQSQSPSPGPATHLSSDSTTVPAPEVISIGSILASCKLDSEHLGPVMEELGIHTAEEARALASMPNEDVTAFFEKHHEKLGMSELQRFVFVSKCKKLA
ncbi:hypothetical protein CONPUDRAFT_158070 [Coniophora puteana RWD-64-598 SS2]|uniref:Uncharacterized protein n=1 Tax=Coniophora puteana (strain RWD-64-598) TaxID=741705 RepID=A0A5M3ME85_CONPW|nr:uncharacterized protein CONPUDRAFT_158070 [Coniophora puteana RWD-64-598 SS2]EIW76925.1 hypothetical protein CONPUDRAFT_158070 [Coniophora puteana RWD-64-598 SS2]